MVRIFFILLATVSWFLPVDGAAEDESSTEEVERYSTPEERRNAGEEHQLTDWLVVEALLEGESTAFRYPSDEAQSSKTKYENGGTLQLGVEAEMRPWAKLECVAEYDFAKGNSRIEEAFAAYEKGEVELKVGILYLPFGVFYSQFVTDPFLQFGETRDRAVILTSGNDSEFEMTIFSYIGLAKPEADGQEVDWGLAATYSPEDGGLGTGVSFISDLADSDEGLLGDSDHRFRRRVAGLSAFVDYDASVLKVTAELVGALRSFSELEEDFNAPLGWNVELTAPVHDVSWSVRAEGSKELEDGARFRVGIAATLTVLNRANLTLELLDGFYTDGVLDDRGQTRAQQLGAQFSVEF